MNEFWNSIRRLLRGYLPFIFTLCVLLLPLSYNRALHRWMVNCIWNIRVLYMRSVSSDQAISEIGKKRMLEEQKYALLWSEEEYTKQLEEQEASTDSLYNHILAPSSSLKTASVIYQEPNRQNTALWINIGAKTDPLAHLSLGADFPIQVNCPVLSRGIVIGCVDYVGDYVSRVLLISNPDMSVSVQVKRPTKLAISAIETGIAFEKAIQRYGKRNNALFLKKGVAAVQAILRSLHKEVSSSDIPYMYFAKGKLQGSHLADRGLIFEGIGFMYRKNQAFNDESEKTIAIQPGDILETSGFDGVFPKGLPVAEVSHVYPLIEGQATYTIEATSLETTFPLFDYVSILPGLPSQIKEPPSTVDRILSLLDET